MALSANEMAETLIRIYKESENKKKGMYRLSKEEFKRIAGKAALKEAYFWEVDSGLREDGFMLVDMRQEYEKIGVLSMATVIKKSQELPPELIEDNAFDEDDEEW